MNSEVLTTVRIRYLIAIAAAAFVGLIDSAYLTLAHYRAVALSCTIITGCEKVLNSNFSVIGPIPLSALGMLFYLAILAAVILLYYWEPRLPYARLGFMVLTAAGFLMSLIFISIQIFLIHAICQYCLLSALTSTVIFACALCRYRGRATERPLRDERSTVA